MSKYLSHGCYAIYLQGQENNPLSLAIQSPYDNQPLLSPLSPLSLFSSLSLFRTLS